MDPSKLLSPEKLKILNQIDTEYQCYYKWFLALTEIHHPTFDVKEITSKIVDWCKEMKADVKIDKDLNIVVYLQPNGMPEESPTVCIQTHTDMVWVGERINNVIKVELQNKENKRILVAPYSTLGADDGFGVALCLEMIEKRNEFIHPKMEIIMTSDEECGLIGVKKLPKKGQTDNEIKPFEFKYYINTDTLKGDKIYIGSCGGYMYEFYYEPKFEEINPNEDKLIKVNISIEDCKGGHSGATIQNGQANPLKLIGQILKNLTKNDINYRILKIDGGHAINAIPTSCSVSILIEENLKEKANEIINTQYDSIFRGYKSIEQNMKLNLSFEDKLTEKLNAISKEHSKGIINVIMALPHGVFRYHPEYNDTVDSSINLAQIHLKENNKIFIEMYSRAISHCELEKIDCIVESVQEMSNVPHIFKKKISGNPWNAPESKLSQLMLESAKKIIGENIKIGVLPVTIEPSEFLSLGYTNCEMVAVCPSVPLAHCIGEWMDIDEAMKWKKVILEVIAKLNN